MRNDNVITFCRTSVGRESNLPKLETTKRRETLNLRIKSDLRGLIDRAADTVGIRGIVVHAISEEAMRFYLAIGFEPSPTNQ